MPTIAYFPLGIAVMTWLGGVMDISSMAKRHGATRGAHEQPQPPVNLPFE